MNVHNNLTATRGTTEPQQEEDVQHPIQASPRTHASDEDSSGSSREELVPGMHMPPTTHGTNGSTRIGVTFEVARLDYKQHEARV